MEKLGFFFWIRICIASAFLIEVAWRLSTGHFPHSGSWEESLKFLFAFSLAAYALEAYDRSEKNARTISELTAEIGLLRSEIEELTDSSANNEFTG